jgi:hypothetical protein
MKGQPINVEGQTGVEGSGGSNSITVSGFPPKYLPLHTLHSLHTLHYSFSSFFPERKNNNNKG